MRFDKSAWFNGLDKILNKIRLDDAFLIYYVEIGEIKFQIVVEKHTQFIQAVEAFYAAKVIKHRIASIPTIFCVDQNLAKKIISEVGSEVIAHNFHQDNKAFKEKNIIINDSPRSLIKAFNASTGLGLFACKEFKNLSAWEFFSPLKEFIHLIALQSGCWLVHAGSIVDQNKGILFVGPGRSGKSSATISLMSQFMKTAGDDYVCLSKDSKVYSVYRTVKHLGDHFIKSLACLKDYPYKIDNHSNKKVYLCNASLEEGPFIASFQLKGIYGLKLDATATEKMVITNDLSFDYFLMSTIAQIPLWIDQSMLLAGSIFRKMNKKLITLSMGEASHHDLIHYLTETINENH